MRDKEEITRQLLIVLDDAISTLHKDASQSELVSLKVSPTTESMRDAADILSEVRKRLRDGHTVVSFNL